MILTFSKDPIDWPLAELYIEQAMECYLK